MDIREPGPRSPGSNGRSRVRKSYGAKGFTYVKVPPMAMLVPLPIGIFCGYIVILVAFFLRMGAGVYSASMDERTRIRLTKYSTKAG
jgi:hypothetical protein